MELIAAGILIILPSDKKPIGWILVALGALPLTWIATQWFRSNFRLVSPIVRSPGRTAISADQILRIRYSTKDPDTVKREWNQVLDGEPTMERVFLQENPLDVWRAITDDSVTSLERESRAKKYIGKWWKLNSVVIDVDEPEWTEHVTVQLQSPDAFVMLAEFDKSTYGEHARTLNPNDRVRFIGRIDRLERLKLILTNCEPR